MCPQNRCYLRVCSRSETTTRLIEEHIGKKQEKIEYPELPKWAQCILKSRRVRQKKRIRESLPQESVQGDAVLDLKMEERYYLQGMAGRSWKRQEMESPLEPPERKAALWTR